MKERTPPEGLSTAVAALEKTETTEQHPAKDSYPPISSIPNTSPKRLAQAAEDAPKEVAQAATTVLYLAYGSNMSAETFLGRRRIRPLSQMNVSVPILRLTFDLPGLPYREPCFANVGYRKLPGKPKLPDPLHPPIVPPLNPPKSGLDWDGGLMGVVYEVTQEDFRNIMRTEGGGSGYQEIMVPCLPMPADVGVPEKPAFPDLPKPFLATTLYAPYIPLDSESGKRSWWSRFIIGPHRPNPDYAQPSARYLKLLMDGAREHDLPQVYQDYLASMQPYTATTLRQKIGQSMFLLFWAPMLIYFMTVTRVLADERGKVPRWCASIISGSFGIMWYSYDKVFRTIFGDGERTEESQQNTTRRKSYSAGTDEEKASLMQEDEENDE
ncbi:gliotoxin biosynthesis [Trichoderma arundinaceum]|uniref:gamma-glutamylcyclotransferase n=1 Tax=Trichoderma arundinaceum TaxID=490622 RepID=A0A395NWN5_TRIAR|nr:gliotoxin biosynthesis [Trichoderma arundinaceum]